MKKVKFVGKYKKTKVIRKRKRYGSCSQLYLAVLGRENETKVGR